MKWVAGFGANSARGLPAIHAVVVLNDPETGVPAAILDGGPITAERTAAVCGVAIRHFAPAPGRPAEIALIGAGVQGRTHLPVLGHVLPGSTLHVFDRHPDRAEALAEAARATDGIAAAAAHTDGPRGRRRRRRRRHGRVVRLAGPAPGDDQRLAPAGRDRRARRLRDVLRRRGRPRRRAVPRRPSRPVPRQSRRRQLRRLPGPGRDARRGDPRRHAAARPAASSSPISASGSRTSCSPTPSSAPPRDRGPGHYPSPLRRADMRRALAVRGPPRGAPVQAGRRSSSSLVLLALLVLGSITTQRGWPQTDGTLAVDGPRPAGDGRPRRRRHRPDHAPTTRTTCSWPRATSTPRSGCGRWRSGATSGPAGCPSCSARAHVDRDRYIRTLGWRAAAQRDLDAMSPETSASLDAYADGVNAWITEHDGRLSTPFVVAGLLSGTGGVGGYHARAVDAARHGDLAEGPGWSLGGNSTARSSGCSPTRGSAIRPGPTSSSRPTTATAPVITPSGLDGAGGAGAEHGGQRNAASTAATAAARPLATSMPRRWRDLATARRRRSRALAGLDDGDGLVGDHGVGSNNWVVVRRAHATAASRSSPTTPTSGSGCPRSGS